MAYAVCVAARIEEMSHALDNIVSGTVSHDGIQTPFRTRGHIVKATNKIYQANPWKPSKGDRVLIDGDFQKDGTLIVDHIEKDWVEAAGAVDVPMLAKIAERLPSMQEMTSGLRHRKPKVPGEPTRLRWVKPFTVLHDRCERSDAVLHAVLDEDGWYLWGIEKTTGKPASASRADGLHRLMADALGIPSMVAINPPPPSAMASPPADDGSPPYDDCPF